MKQKGFLKGNTFRRIVFKKPESGRSMIEMLGVLAIIGLISAASIGFFKYALDFWEARNIQTIITQSKVLTVTKQTRQKVGEDGTIHNTGLSRFLKRTPLKGYSENVNTMLEIEQGESERDYIYMIHLDNVPFNVQKFIWRDKARFAEEGIAINPTQELINEFEDEDGQAIQTKEAWIALGMYVDTADVLERKLGIESNDKITFLFNVTRRIGGGREEEITPPGPEDEYCAIYDCDCKGQPLPYYEYGVVIECEAGKYYDGELGRCIGCDIAECVEGTTAEKAEDCYEWEEFVDGCCVKKKNPSSDSSDSDDPSEPNEHCPPEKPYYDEETGKCVSRCQLGKKFLSDWKACISCDYNGAVTIDDTEEGRSYCTGCILTTEGSRQVKKNPKNETYCVYNSCTPGLELQLQSGECQTCEPGLYPINIGSEALGSETLCRACGGEVLSTGHCRIPCPAGQYMDLEGQCHGCDECTGYEVGGYTIKDEQDIINVADPYYEENCLACGNKEIDAIELHYIAGRSIYKTYCKDKGQFGWFSSGVFMCKTCADLPVAGISKRSITQEDCEMCGLWESSGSRISSNDSVCCPKNTFYSYSEGKCLPCDTPDSILMVSSYNDRYNCEEFCGDKRTLVGGHLAYCQLKKKCAKGELLDIDENKCYLCNSDIGSIHVGTGADAVSACAACSNRDYQNGYCSKLCPNNQYRDIDGNCRSCDECTGYEASTIGASACTTACPNRKIEEGGRCVLKKMPTGQYMDKNGICRGCDKCTGYYVGNDTSRDVFYRKGCLACGDKEINSKGICKDKGQFGWVSSSGMFCKTCADIPEEGVQYYNITQEECEMCGLWESYWSGYVCCPKGTFYSDYSGNRQCHACNTSDSIEMSKYNDRSNCETFCGTQRVLANKSGKYYCELKKRCGTGQLYDIDENECYPCDSNKIFIHVGTEGNAMRDCTACGNREYRNGFCVLLCSKNQYRDVENNCRNCNECTGYVVGNGSTQDTYYRESCLACGNREIQRIMDYDTDKDDEYCVDKGKFGWLPSSSSSEFMCKACADIPETGIGYNKITKEVCERCGWWYGICCPKNTFYSGNNMMCYSCDTPDSIQMGKSYADPNCEKFCGDKRVLAKRDAYYCELRKVCAKGQIRNSETNICQNCRDAVNIPINGDETVRNWCLSCQGRRVEVDGATGAEFCVLGSCSANGNGDSQFIGSNGRCYTCEYQSRVRIDTSNANMQSTLQDLCKGSDKCGRVITTIGDAIYCDPKCVSGEEYRDETGYCSTCSGLTPDNSPITDSTESRALCTACGGTPGTPEGLTGLYCIK